MLTEMRNMRRSISFEKSYHTQKQTDYYDDDGEKEIASLIIR